jgi:hypothetical protein
VGKIRCGKLKKVSVNKINNAKSQVYDGIQFLSGLEVYCYQQLKEHNIYVEYEPISFVIIEAFTYGNEKIRPMTYKPDFVGEEFIIECKGWMNESFPLRWKMFKYMLYRNKIIYDIYLPRKRTDVDEVIVQILKKRDEKKSKTVQY